MQSGAIGCGSQDKCKAFSCDCQPIGAQTKSGPIKNGIQGCCNVAMFLCFVAAVSDGNVDAMTKQVSNLTWFEEWFLYCEFMYGKTISSLQAAAALYGISNPRTIPKVIDAKLDLVLTARRRWPKYATMQEDAKLRNKSWDLNYKDKRIVMWDNTGIRLHKPTDALLQRMTYSSYYAGNVGKGGIFVQLCGWMGTHELYPGAMSDSDYLNKITSILEEQKAFQEKDGGIPFTNISNKGNC